MSKFNGMMCVAILALAGSIASAGQVSYNDSVADTTTNWSDTLTVPKWDPALYPGQTLQSVKLILSGSVTGEARYESLDAGTANITLNLQATIDLQKPGGGNVVQVIPVANVNELAAAFDGVIDFDGGSGSTFTGLSGNASDSQTLTLPADLALFTGAGNVNMQVDALGSSFGSGAGNLITQFATDAGADLEVVYTWVPEPTSVALIGLGGLVLLRRRIG